MLLEVLKGKYQIVREIARSNDIVYEAIDVTLGRRVALKELNIPPSLTGQPRRERIERFNREARAASRLNQPNIVTVYEFGEEDGRHFIAMEYLEGQTLRDSLDMRGTIPLKEALDIANQVLDALAYAHSHQVIHRDIKPDNIHLLPGGRIKLTDFGIARLIEEPALTQNGQVFGTPSYMSPEQIEGQGIDHRSDLFSLGVVLYEMLSGRKPFTGDSVISITYAVMNAEPPPLVGVPVGVEQVIRRSLSKRPFNRHAAADLMKLDLQYAEQAPAMFMPPTALTPPSSVYSGPVSSNHGGLPDLLAPQPPPVIQPSGGTGPLGSNGSLPGVRVPTGPPPWTSNSGNGARASGQGTTTFDRPSTSGALVRAGSALSRPVPPPSQDEAAIVLTPGGRALLVSLLLAILFGGGIALGVIAFQRGYEHYSVRAEASRVVSLAKQAETKYNARDYAGAASLYEQALNAGPAATDRQNVVLGLVYSYIQTGDQEKANNNLPMAERAYQRALAILPDNRLAHERLATIYQLQGNLPQAQQHQEAAKLASPTPDIPATLENAPLSTSDPNQGTDPQEFQANRRQEAQNLIEEGKRLRSQGNTTEARAKWQAVVSRAPATPESDEAKALLRELRSTPSFGNGE